MGPIAKGIDAFLGPRLLLIPPRTTKRRVELVFVERLLERVGLHDLRVFLAVLQRVQPQLAALFVGVDQQLPPQLMPHVTFPERDHLAELPSGIDMHQRKRGLGRIEGFHGQLDHDRRIFADRIEHDRVLKLSRDLADDVDALRLKLLQVGQAVARHNHLAGKWPLRTRK